METVTIEQLVHGGQGLATMADGRKVFVWNALPGERVEIRIIKDKRSYAEAIAENILEAAPQRVAAEESNYLATSPWQILDWAAENEAKRTISLELFAREHVAIPEVAPTVHGENQWHYRNKMEYSFWGDDDGLHLALHQRGSHGKQIVQGSRLAHPAVDAAAQAVVDLLQQHGVRGTSLKTIMVRSNQAGVAVAALFVKTTHFPKLPLPTELQGLRVYYSNPRSPASVPTELLYELGSALLVDDLLGRPFYYDVNSFFQVNPSVFEKALQTIKATLQAAPIVTDMYAGVGAIGLSVASQQIDLVELDVASAAMASRNASDSGLESQVFQTASERALSYIYGDRPIIFDPPRAGLHPSIVERVLEVAPPTIIYLSCNPATQARDLALLQGQYTIKRLEIYNFFPKTPHIEALAVLERTNS